LAKLGDKYIAGFLDADGSIGAQFVGGSCYPQISVTFAQNADQDEVLHRIHEELGAGSICERTSNAGTRYSSLTLRGKDAHMLLSRIQAHLVVKRHFAGVVLDLYRRKVSREEMPRIIEYLKVHRYMRSLPLPKHPSRGWVAGYLDGDGCFSVTSLNALGSVGSLVLHVAGDARKDEGLELLQKAFGGRLNSMCAGRCRQWTLSLDPAKVSAMLPDIAKRMVVKADQAYFLLGCAKMGHFRDGKNIKAGLKHLKAQPHRLNGPRADVAKLLGTVRDLPKAKRSYEGFTRDRWGRITGRESVQATVGARTVT
jgi:hypothetical protein